MIATLHRVILGLSAGLLALVCGCSPTLPPRYVVERDLDEYSYRRFQKILDVEFGVQGNEAEAYTAVYIRRAPNDVPSSEAVSTTASAMVTVYAQAASLSSEVRDRLALLGSYDTSVVRLSGENVWQLDGDETPWLLWVSGRHLVKIGWSDPERRPDAVIDWYLDAYPSDLDSNGRAKEGSASEGPSQAQEADSAEDELDIPASLREGVVE